MFERLPVTAICVIQARMSSSRLPGKVMAEIADTPMLARVISRVKNARTVAAIIVATSTADVDDPIVDLCSASGVVVVRGSEYDVLDRYWMATAQFPAATHIVRVTADCPFVDPTVLDDVVEMCLAEDLDYCTNQPADPRLQSFPLGLAVECFTREALENAWRLATKPNEREHVTPGIYGNPACRAGVLSLPTDLSMFRWTVDTPEDLGVVRILAEGFGDSTTYSWRDVLRVAQDNPQLTQRNGGVRQRLPVEVDTRYWVAHQREVNDPR